MSTIYAYANRQYNAVVQIVNRDGTSAAGVYTSATTLVANVYEGQELAAIFQPTVSWYNTTGYNTGQVALGISAAQTASLDPAGEYRVLIDVATGGVTSPGWEGRLKILSTPGSNTLAPPDLISYDYAFAALSSLTLSDTQRDFVPYLVSSASEAVRRFCFNRYFDLRTLTEYYDVEPDGTIRLYQVPVQQVIRVQGPQQLALTVYNTGSQFANVYFTYTGSESGYGSNAQTITGMTLTYTNNGTASTSTVTFTSNQTISALATVINALGGGWVASADTTLGAWPVTELYGGLVGQGCGPYASPGDGAKFYILQDLTNCRLRSQKTGIMWTGTQNSNSNASRWGTDGPELFDFDSPTYAQVKVQYVSGYSTIPSEVQYQTAQLVKWKLELGIQDLLLKAESNGSYSYELADQMVAAMPATVRQGLSPWRLHYAT